jgi:hypothetical protein
MSPLSRRFLISAAAFLTAGIGIGLWMLFAREAWGRWPTPYQISAHAHLILVGAVIQTIFGTALWLFPRPPRAERPAREWWGEAAWWALTLGTSLRAVGELARSRPTMLFAGIVISAGTLQVLGMLAGILALKPRIRPAIERAR